MNATEVQICAWFGHGFRHSTCLLKYVNSGVSYLKEMLYCSGEPCLEGWVCPKRGTSKTCGFLEA